MQMFGRYVVVECISSGSRSEVFIARYASGVNASEKLLAVRRMPLALTADEIQASRFQKEIIKVMKFEHPQVERVIDFGMWDGKIYVVSEYISGVCVADFLDSTDSLEPGFFARIPAACEIVRQLAQAVHSAHSSRDSNTQIIHKIVHSRIESKKVIISQQGVIKLRGLGIARAECEASGIREFFPYSPEELQASALDEKSDIFSLGILLWELLTRQQLLDGRSREQREIVLKKPILPASLVNEGVDPMLDELLSAALQKRPELRPQSALEFARSLEPFCRPLEESDIADHFLKHFPQSVELRQRLINSAFNSLNSPVTAVTKTIELSVFKNGLRPMAKSLEGELNSPAQRPGERKITPLDWDATEQQTIPSVLIDPELKTENASKTERREVAKKLLVEHSSLPRNFKRPYFSSAKKKEIKPSLGAAGFIFLIIAACFFTRSFAISNFCRLGISHGFKISRFCSMALSERHVANMIAHSTSVSSGEAKVQFVGSTHELGSPSQFSFRETQVEEIHGVSGVAQMLPGETKYKISFSVAAVGSRSVTAVLRLNGSDKEYAQVSVEPNSQRTLHQSSAEGVSISDLVVGAGSEGRTTIRFIVSFAEEVTQVLQLDLRGNEVPGNKARYTGDPSSGLDVENVQAGPAEADAS